MLTFTHRKNISRLVRNGRLALTALMLAAAFPASIYAQDHSRFLIAPSPQANQGRNSRDLPPIDTRNPEMVRVAQVPALPGNPQGAGAPAVQQPNRPAANQPPPNNFARPQNPSRPVESLQNEVQIVVDPETGRVTLIGDPADTAIVRKAFEDISRQSDRPGVERILLKNLSGAQIAESVQEIYDARYAETQGAAIIKPLRSPNGLYVFGTPQGINSVREIVNIVDGDAPELDVEDGPFQTFQLRHISAADAKRRLDLYFGNTAQGGNEDERIPQDPVTIVADFRSNVLIVRGARQFLEQAEAVIRSIDVDGGSATDVVRIFPLRNTIAEEMAVVLQDAINGQQPNAGLGFNPDPNNLQQAAQQTQGDDFSSSLRSSGASLSTVSPDGRVVTGGIMFDVRVSANRNSNSLIVRGPAASMDFISELISQLDRLPNTETLLKVFAVENGDAQSLLDTLEALFPTDQNQAAGGGLGGATGTTGAPLQSASATAGASLVNLRFSIDERTNSIIATGPAGDLQVVEDLINRLDEDQADRRQTVVHRLSNSPVLDVQEALNTWIEARQDRNGDDPRTSPGVNLADRDVDVIPEVVSNSLIISATPEYLPEIMAVIRRLDRRPPMVKVKVLIAEVNLNALEEFGVEVGIQDSLLFDRGTTLIGNAIQAGTADAPSIGFPFNNPSLVTNANAIFPETLAGQALANFGTGRVNASGQSGLVLSAGNESVNILIRALQARGCMRVLSKPHLVTLENLQGRVQVGQQVPRITGSTQSTNGGGVQNSVEDVDVGVIVEMTPRVSPDGMIVMFVNATKSALATGAAGIPVAVDAAGNPVVQQPINSTSAQTTVMARSGQTVVFSGLIQESKSHTETGIPILADLPLVGPLFKFENDTNERTELMIIMTPYLIDGDEELEIQNQDEMDRMHWCLCDVAEVYGKTDYNGYQPEEGAVETIYPDQGFQPVDPETFAASQNANQNYPAQQYAEPPVVDNRQFENGTPIGRAHRFNPDGPGGFSNGSQSFGGSETKGRWGGNGESAGRARRSWNPFSKNANRQTSYESQR